MRSHQSGFTLVELLIVVLIIGILATIAIPVFNGQRTKAKNSAAQSAVRQGLSAAIVLSVANNDSFSGIDSTELVKEEKSLTAASGTQDLPGAGATPRKVWVYNVTSTGAADTAVQTASDNGIVLCVTSVGDKIFCMRSLRKTVGGVQAGTSFGSGTTVATATSTWSTNW